MPPPGRMVILNGVSSSGKTTLATAFRDWRAVLGELWLLVGIDDFLSKLPVAWLDLGLAAGPGAHAQDGLRFEDWLDVLGDLQSTWVAVRCSPEIAVQREQARGDRPIGMTSTQTTKVHRHLTYAFEIDTGVLSPDEALADLCAGLGLRR